MTTRTSSAMVMLTALLCMLPMLTGCHDSHRLPQGTLYRCDKYTITADSLIERNGITVRATSSMHLSYSTNRRDWRLTDIPTSYPRATLGMKLPDALYNLGVANINSDTTATFSPYAVMLSLAYLDPQRAMRTLRSLVKNGRISPLDETAWPIDVSRVAWIVAAAEVYKVTGDKAWGKEVFEVARLSLRDDSHVNYRADKELYCGGMVPLSRASQYYPKWMGAIDVFNTMSLTANALYARAYSDMAAIGDALGLDTGKYSEIATRLKHAINLYLWIPDKGRYSQYLYGRFPIQSDVSDNLGQALCMLFDIATPEMAQRIFERTPQTYYGVPAIWPALTAAANRYSNCVRSDALAFWTLAAAKSGDVESLRLGLAAQMRSAALFGGAVPYTDASTGEALVDSLSPSQRINGAAARLATTFRVFAGMRFTEEGILFKPVVPAEYHEEKFISGFRYRDAELSIVVHGTGDRIARFAIDGKLTDSYLFPAGLTGRHNIEITLASNEMTRRSIDFESDAPVTPDIPTLEGSQSGLFTIADFDSDTKYNIWINGAFEERADSASFRLFDTSRFAAVSVSETDASGYTSFTCRPLFYAPDGAVAIIQAEDFAAAGTTLIADSLQRTTVTELSATRMSHLSADVVVASAGRYMVDLRYANGGGHISQQRDCGMRTLLVNGNRAGVFVMPQLGLGRWDISGFSNMLEVNLEEGQNTLSIDYVVPYNINTAASDNIILLDYLRLIRL